MAEESVLTGDPEPGGFRYSAACHLGGCGHELGPGHPMRVYRVPSRYTGLASPRRAFAACGHHEPCDWVVQLGRPCPTHAAAADAPGCTAEPPAVVALVGPASTTVPERYKGSTGRWECRRCGHIRAGSGEEGEAFQARLVQCDGLILEVECAAHPPCTRLERSGVYCDRHKREPDAAGACVVLTNRGRR